MARAAPRGNPVLPAYGFASGRRNVPPGAKIHAVDPLCRSPLKQSVVLRGVLERKEPTGWKGVNLRGR